MPCCGGLTRGFVDFPLGMLWGIDAVREGRRNLCSSVMSMMRGCAVIFNYNVVLLLQEIARIIPCDFFSAMSSRLVSDGFLLISVRM